MKNLLQISEISLLLDSYDDIFSDFDPRSYAQRSLSVDFLREAERASKDKDDFDLNLLIPKKLRSAPKERMIRKRLKTHFKKHAQKIEQKYKKMLTHGALFTFTGIACMLGAVYILHTLQPTTLFQNFMLVLLEPGGWFLFWEGLNITLFESKKIKPELDFYNKMHRCIINFLDY